MTRASLKGLLRKDLREYRAHMLGMAATSGVEAIGRMLRAQSAGDRAKYLKARADADYYAYAWFTLNSAPILIPPQWWLDSRRRV